MMINPNYDAENQEENMSHNEDAAPLTGGPAEGLHDLYFDSGFVAERTGDLKLAVGLYEQAIHSQPDSALAWYNYGDALLALNRPEEAVAALRATLRKAIRRLVVDFSSSMNRITRETNTSMSPRSIAQEPPEAVGTDSITRPMWSCAIALRKPCGMIMARAL